MDDYHRLRCLRARFDVTVAAVVRASGVLGGIAASGVFLKYQLLACLGLVSPLNTRTTHYPAVSSFFPPWPGSYKGNSLRFVPSSHFVKLSSLSPVSRQLIATFGSNNCTTNQIKQQPCQTAPVWLCLLRGQPSSSGDSVPAMLPSTSSTCARQRSLSHLNI